MAKTCFDRFRRITYITEKVASICGCNALQDDFKVNFHTWFVIIAINAFFCCTIYTIYTGYVVDGDWKVILQSLSLVGSAVQGLSKMISAIYRRLIMMSMQEKLDRIYKEYQTDEDYLPILRYRTDLTTKILKIVMGIYAVTVIGIIAYPIIYGRLLGEKLLIMQFFLPGVDYTTDSGFMTSNIVHAFLIALGGFGNFAGDMYILTFITHVPLFKDVLKIKCRKLNGVLRGTNSHQKTMLMLKELAQWHQSCNIYAQEVEEAYYAVIFVQIFTSVVSISCTLFSIVIRSWPAAFVYLAYSLSMLYTYCGLGHLVEISNDEVVDVIYCECLWYQLSIAEQKIILLMIRKSQKPITLTIGQVMPLSMSTALQLTKAIYSYMMMLLNFLEMDE